MRWSLKRVLNLTLTETRLSLSPLPPEHIFCNEHHFLIPSNKYNKGEFAFAFERAPFENDRSQKDWNELFRDGRRHPRPCRLASSQDEDLRLQPGHGMCLLQGETKTISCYKVIFIFFAWNKLVLQSWLLGCSPWLTMWTRKSARESFSSDRWKSNITTELIFWEMWSAIFLQTEKIHLPHPAELVMMSHEAGWARIYMIYIIYWGWVSKKYLPCLKIPFTKNSMLGEQK